MTRPGRNWSHSQSERCPVWETRYVRGQHDSLTRTRPLQVRCSEPKATEHEHQWMKVPFGVLDKPTPPTGRYCDVITRETGERCRQPTRGGRCANHR